MIPDAHPGRAQRAGGHSSLNQTRTRIPIFVQHGRTSRTVAHGNPYINCNVSYKIRRARATVGLPDSVLSHHPTPRKMSGTGCNPVRAQRAGSRSSLNQIRTRIPIFVHHCRTSRSVAHENPYINCNVTYKIRRARATVGLPDSVLSHHPNSEKKGGLE